MFKEFDGINYYDVKASGTGDALVFTYPFTGAMTGNYSEYFIDDVEGYYLDDMVFLVDEQTFNKILSKPVAGTGSIRWIGYRNDVSSGHNYKRSTEPRVIFGHNIGPKLYEQIMNTEKVQEFLGLK